MPCCSRSGSEGGRTFFRVRKGEGGRTHKVRMLYLTDSFSLLKRLGPFCDRVHRLLSGPDFCSGADVRVCQSPESRSIFAADLTSLLT